MAYNSSEGDSIKIFLRVRPPDPSISENDFAPRVLDVNTADNAVILRTKPEPKVFTYDNVADADITQEAVFSIVGKKIIESCIAGYNGTIFAYGQTGSGKTFTMLGPSENSDSFKHELRGVIPRSFEYLFNLIAHQAELHGTKKQFLCRCSFLEIYQEQIFDLLDPASQGLHLRENMNKGVFVDGLIEQVICNPGDAYQVLIMGWLNRRVAATSMNRESSRSHAVFTVTIESKEDDCGVQNIRTSQLNLVDLAGSERQKDTNTGGTRLKEAGSINKSLSVLGNVIMSLVDLSHGRKRHIPYRDSKLTFLLRDSLGGNTKTRMIACVHPDSKCFGETLSTLNFARSAKLIKNKAVVNEDFHGSNLKLQNEIRRLKELLESQQNASPPVENLLTLPNEAAMNSDSVWKKNFIEAMHFREISESEKTALQDVVNHLQELCNKKDKYIQSTKMIIKFRENHIQSLQQAAQGYTELEKDTVVKSLRDEIKVLRQQLENNPMLAKYAGENKHLRSELKRLRSQESVADEFGDSFRISQLEKIFKELKLLKEMKGGNTAAASVRSSPMKDGVPAATLEKHRKEIKEHQEQIEQLKQQVLEVTKKAENRQMEMEIELVSCRKMITELERVLEAHQLKARIECNALKDLHCQTLKVMTTPKMNGKCDSPGTPTVGEAANTEQGITETALPQDVAEGAHDALMEEIQTLQVENGKLKKLVDDHEAEKLRMKQQVEKLELYNEQLNGVLEKERTENTSRRNDYTTAVNTLKEEIDTVKNDLKLLNDENTDIHLVLKSADKQLKEEKESRKNLQATYTQEIQVLETRFARANIDLETTTRDYEEALKELGSIKEELETNRLTVSFLENHSQELEALRNLEIKKREKLEMDYNALQSSGSMQSYQEYKEQAETNLKLKQAELEAVRAEQEQVIAQQARAMADNKEAIANLMSNLHELKSKLNSQEEVNGTLSMENENYALELKDLKRDQELTSKELACVQQELKDIKEKYKHQLMQKVFEIDNLQQDQESANSHLLKQEEIISSLQGQAKTKDLLCKDLQDTVDTYKKKLSDAEQAMQEVVNRYEKRLQEASASDKDTDSIKKLMQDKNVELESLRVNYKKLNSALRDYEQARKEKNEENELLKAQVLELEVCNQSLLTGKQEIEELQMKMNALNVNNKELIKSMEASLKGKEEELQKERSSLRKAELSLGNVQEECKTLEKKLETSEMERGHFRQEVNRLQTRLEAHHQEKTELHSQIESLAEEKAKLATEYQVEKERNQQLMEESSRLIGHNNHQQKIKLMEKKNMEYNELHKKYERLLLETSKMNLKTPGKSANPSDWRTPTSQSPGMRDITNTPT
ncbi:kinesin-like protein KIF15 isoform X2 [Aplysia californica]|uniref:Kinesin-like protein KIF15 isoform X2 n=1 Tax=Aplysia californica TaxID=6500 RepID=A0ABM1VYY2_APLCA|nr:kinesin-like protein KIF15 isoform X2 [Aplysia californica]